MGDSEMTWLKENWFKLGILAVLGISVVSAFYWFEYRPIKIKERCSAEAHFGLRLLVETNDNKRQELINNSYNDCLMRFGLK